jgi:hypothetical protein
MDGARPRNAQGNGARLNRRIEALAGSEERGTEGGAITGPPKATAIPAALGDDIHDHLKRRRPKQSPPQKAPYERLADAMDSRVAN